MYVRVCVVVFNSYPTCFWTCTNFRHIGSCGLPRFCPWFCILRPCLYLRVISIQPSSCRGTFGGGHCWWRSSRACQYGWWSASNENLPHRPIQKSKPTTKTCFRLDPPGGYPVQQRKMIMQCLLVPVDFLFVFLCVCVCVSVLGITCGVVS